jgi:hypothetical protein
MEQPQMNLDITSTTPITGPNGEQIFQEGFLLRKVSKFISGGTEDGILPLPCFYEITTGKVVLASLPPNMREEYKEIGI